MCRLARGQSLEVARESGTQKGTIFTRPLQRKAATLLCMTRSLAFPLLLVCTLVGCGGSSKKKAEVPSEDKPADSEAGSGTQEAVALLARPSKWAEYAETAATPMGKKQFSISLESAEAMIDLNDEGDPASAKVSVGGAAPVSVSFSCKTEESGLFCVATRAEVKTPKGMASLQLEVVRPLGKFKGKAAELEAKLNASELEVKADANGALALATLDMPIGISPGKEGAAHAVAADEARFSTIPLSSRPRTVEVFAGATHIRIRRGQADFDAIFKPMIAESKGGCKYEKQKGDAKVVVCKASGSSDRSIMVARTINEEPYVCYGIRIPGKKEADDALAWCASLH